LTIAAQSCQRVSAYLPVNVLVCKDPEEYQVTGQDQNERRLSQINQTPKIALFCIIGHIQVKMSKVYISAHPLLVTPSKSLQDLAHMCQLYEPHREKGRAGAESGQEKQRKLREQARKSKAGEVAEDDAWEVRESKKTQRPHYLSSPTGKSRWEASSFQRLFSALSNVFLSN
jgi:hypothetical protein